MVHGWANFTKYSKKRNQEFTSYMSGPQIVRVITKPYKTSTRPRYWLMHFTYHFYVIFFSWGNLSIYDIKGNDHALLIGTPDVCQISPGLAMVTEEDLHYSVEQGGRLNFRPSNTLSKAACVSLYCLETGLLPWRKSRSDERFFSVW